MRRTEAATAQKLEATHEDRVNFRIEYLDSLRMPSSYNNQYAVYHGDKLADFVGDRRTFGPDTNVQILMLGGADADFNYQQLRWPDEMAQVRQVLQEMIPTAQIYVHSYIKVGQAEEAQTHARRDTFRGKLLVQYDPQFNVVVRLNDQGENTGFSQFAAYRVWFEDL